jgi:type III pantothenate kinase
MTPDIVVDIGNTQVKWGVCGRDGIRHMARLDATASAWEDCLAMWRRELPELLPNRPLSWAIADVVPDMRRTIQSWIETRGDTAVVLRSYEQLPVEVKVDAPERVGIDRLLNAVAARGRSPGVPAVLIDIGSAVTVDWLDETGSFRGGAIFPGFRLMARALRKHTAKLPLVRLPKSVPPLPAVNTTTAMQAGIACAVAGGVFAVARQYLRQSTGRLVVYLTGGDAAAFRDLLADLVKDDPQFPALEVWPEQTLEGIRRSAEALA